MILFKNILFCLLLTLFVDLSYSNPLLTKRYVVFGSVGAGKSTLVKLLGAALNLKSYVEPKEEWNKQLFSFMNSKYKPIAGTLQQQQEHKLNSDAAARCKYAFPLQKQVLKSLHKFHPKHIQTGVFENSPLTVRWTFVELNIKNNNFTPAQIIKYNALDKKLAWDADTYFYLNTSPQTCLKQIKNRIITNEQVGDSEYNIQYLKFLHEVNKSCFHKLKELQQQKSLKVYEIQAPSSLKDLDKTITLMKSYVS